AAARAMGTRTVLLQEGPFCNIGEAGPQSIMLKTKSALAPAINALGLLPPIPDYGCAGHDRILAVSEAYRTRWIAAGVPASGIKVTGVPRYDALVASLQAVAPSR